MTTRRFLAGLALASFATRPLAAGNGRWTRSTPDWGPASVRALVADPGNPDRILAGAENGLFRSDDGGRHWIPIDVNALVFGLAVDPRTFATIYVQTNNDIRKSLDGGRNWRSASTGLATGNDVPTGLTLLENEPSTLFVSVGPDLYRSEDGAASWSVVLAGKSARPVVADPSGSGVLYAPTFRSLFRSRDSGAHWEDLSPPLAPGEEVTSVAVDATGKVLVTTMTRLLWSDNQGDSWDDRPIPFSDLMQVFPNPRVAGLLFVTTYNTSDRQQLHRSRDGGYTWEHLGPLDPHTSQDSLWFTSRPNEVLVASDVPRRSQDDGDHWEFSLTREASIAGALLAADSLDPNLLYAAGGTLRLSRSEDGGGHWSGITDAQFWYVGTMASGLAPGQIRADTGSYGLYETRDAGESWDILSDSPSPIQIVQDPSAESTLYSIRKTTCSGPLFHCQQVPFESTDGGRNWTPLTVPSDSIRQLVVGEGDPTPLFALDSGGSLYQRHGSALESVPAPLIDSLLVMGSGGAELIGMSPFGPTFYESRDSGTTWTPIEPSGLPSFGPAAHLTQLIAGPDGTLYAASPEHVYRSRDGARTWSPLLPDEREDRAVRSLVLSADGRTLHAGTENAVYDYSFCDDCPIPVTNRRLSPRLAPERPHN